MKIHAAMMTFSELTDLKENIELLLPYVDTLTVVDGLSVDQTIIYCRNLERIEPKFKFVLNKWEDDFPKQRNAYLREIRKIANDGDWVLTCDPDEFFSIETLQNLRKLAEVVPKKKERYNSVSFQCISVSHCGPRETWRNVDQHWKTLYFRWSPKVKYGHCGERPVHETLEGVTPTYQVGKHPEFKSLTYEHRKQERITHLRGTRNLFCSGGGDNEGSKNPRWVELRSITDSLNIKSWHEFHKYLLNGNVDDRLKQWMAKYRNIQGVPGASEHREVYLTYYRMFHPEEEPPEFKNETIE